MSDPLNISKRPAYAATSRAMVPRKVVYFGFDAADASVRRRMRQIKEVTQLVGLTFRRVRYNSDYVPEWDNIDLGLLQDGKYAQRLMLMTRAFGKVLGNRDKLKDADLVIARNLDLLAMALAARALGVFRAPIIYDVFDVRSVLLKQSAQAKLMRAAEKRLLAKTALLVVSSPGYLSEYFGPHLGYAGPSLVIENKVDLDILPQDPALRAAWRSPQRAATAPAGDRFVLGWVGALRCARSAEMLCAIARALPWITIRISGKATYCPAHQFTAQFAGIDNIVYTGEYWFPTGLYDVYQGIDLNWDFDMSKHGASGGWLLPNRLYEGGYFGVPHLAEAGSETGKYVERLGIGWTVPANIEAIIALLANVREHYAPVKQRCLDAMDNHFHYDGDIKQIFDRALVDAA